MIASNKGVYSGKLPLSSVGGMDKTDYPHEGTQGETYEERFQNFGDYRFSGGNRILNDGV
jgi:hypothetical protein